MPFDKLGEMDEFVLNEKLDELDEMIKVLKAEKKKLNEKKMQSRNGRPERYRAQALSTFNREPVPPAQRCLTQLEASVYHYPVVVRVM